jgi:hypothetical protein
MAAAPAEPNGASIEAFFRPSTRFRDSHRDNQLLPGLTIENVRVAGITWGDFCGFARQKLVWMTPDVYVCEVNLPVTSDRWVLALGATSGHISLRVHVRSGTADAAATATCDFLLRFFATCEQGDLGLIGSSNSVPYVSGEGLSLFFQESRDDLRKVTLHAMALSEDMCLAIATMSRLDVELTMDGCRLPNDAADAFVECLQSDRGPVKLIDCYIDNQIIASALTGKSRVTKLKPYLNSTMTNDAGRAVWFRALANNINDAEMAVLVTALANNRGLVDLDLEHHRISDDNWSILCESLKAHLTLTSLDLEDTRPMSPAHARIILSAEQKTRRTRVLAEMIQENALLQTITLSEHERDEHIYTQEIRPYLETNLYRPRVHAIKKTCDRPFREKVLGRAMCVCVCV